MTVVGWLILIGDLGIGSAIVKRISEGEEQGSYFTAGITWVFLITTIISMGVVVTRSVIDSYISEFSQYVSFSIAWFIIGLVVAFLLYEIVKSVLKGEKKVHIVGLLDPLKLGVGVSSKLDLCSLASACSACLSVRYLVSLLLDWSEFSG